MEEHHLLELAEAVMCHEKEYNVIINRQVEVSRRPPQRITAPT